MEPFIKCFWIRFLIFYIYFLDDHFYSQNPDITKNVKNEKSENMVFNDTTKTSSNIYLMEGSINI